VVSTGIHNAWSYIRCTFLPCSWGQWREIVRASKFKKRQLGIKDVENIARTMVSNWSPLSALKCSLSFSFSLSFLTPTLTSQLVYCLAHFTGDDKVPPYIHRLIDPSEVTERNADGIPVNLFTDFTEDDYLALRMKNPETLFQDETYMKHLRRHANK